MATRCNLPGCKPEKTGNSAKSEKPGSVGKSTLPGVEVAGFEPAAFWSRIREFVFSPVNSAFCPVLPAFYHSEPCFSGNVRFCHAVFKVDILPFRLILKVQFGVATRSVAASPWPCLAVWSYFWFVVWFHAHFYGQISERFIILRLADRTMFQECVQQLLLPEVEITLLFLGNHRFVFRHFALSFTIITGMSL